MTDTIAGRTIIVLVIGLGSILGLAHYLYQKGIEREAAIGNIERLVDRLIFLSNTITTLDPALRDDAAHRLSGGPIELHWAREPLATLGGFLDAETVALRDHLLMRVPKLVNGGLIVGSSRLDPVEHGLRREADDSHTSLVSLALPDGSWLNLTLVKVLSTAHVAKHPVVCWPWCGRRYCYFGAHGAMVYPPAGATRLGCAATVSDSTQC